jgi:hypothetical protein
MVPAQPILNGSILPGGFQKESFSKLNARRGDRIYPSVCDN